MLLSCAKELEQKKGIPSIRYQRTLAKPFSYEGIGLFSGVRVQMRVLPASAGTGICFRRVDLSEEVTIPARLDFIVGTPRCTILGKGKDVVQMVEHLLSALYAHQIDNAIIEINGPEVPAGDGSALPFIELIQKADIQELENTITNYYLEEPLHWSEGDVHLVALPSKELRYSYTLSYPNHPLLHSQFYSFVMSPERYDEEIAPCRTFSLYEELLPLLDKGLIKGGNFTNGVVIKGKEILTPDGLRFPEEMARHKVLDLIGDLSLMQTVVVAHYIAIRSGHYSNTEFAKKVLHYAKAH